MEETDIIQAKSHTAPVKKRKKKSDGMRQSYNGKVYNTESATSLHAVDYKDAVGRKINASLYLMPRGGFFLYVTGNNVCSCAPAKAIRSRGCCDRYILPLSCEEAKAWAEENGMPEDALNKCFPNVSEALDYDSLKYAERVAFCFEIPAPLYKLLKFKAGESGVPMKIYIMDIITDYLRNN